MAPLTTLVWLPLRPRLTDVAGGLVQREDDEEGEGAMGFQQLGGGSLRGSWMRTPGVCECECRLGWGSGDTVGEACVAV